VGPIVIALSSPTADTNDVAKIVIRSVHGTRRIYIEIRNGDINCTAVDQTTLWGLHQDEWVEELSKLEELRLLARVHMKKILKLERTSARQPETRSRWKPWQNPDSKHRRYIRPVHKARVCASSSRYRTLMR
jgi:hypothetical protein